MIYIFVFLLGIGVSFIKLVPSPANVVFVLFIIVSAIVLLGYAMRDLFYLRKTTITN